MNQPDEIIITPTGKALGAEVQGINLACDISRETRDLLIEAWIDRLYMMLVAMQEK